MEPAKKKKFRQRKRPDWPQTVYKFWARPVGELPAEFWAQAREMTALWNELVELRESAQQGANALVMADGEYLRVAMIVDDQARAFELRLPLYMAKSRDLTKKDFYSSFYDLLDLDSKIGDAVENAKAEVLKHLGAKPAGFDKMRQRGLRNLISEATGELRTALEQWDGRDLKLSRIKATVTGRMKRRKAWLYRNVAAWLTRNYQVIGWESDLNLRKLGMEKGSPAIQNAAKYRQWAGLGEFRTLVKNAAIRNVAELVGVEGAYSTVACHICGVDSDSDGAKIWLECSNGHRWDQDVNAALNLLSQTLQTFEQKRGWREISSSGKAEPLEIPAILRSVAVPCSPH